MPKTGSVTTPTPPSPDGTANGPEPATFSFDRLIVRKAIFEQLPRDPIGTEEDRPTQLQGELKLTLGVEIDEAQPRGQVTLQVVLSPDLKWQPYRLEVVVAGVFRAERLAPTLFDQFCRRAVPSILFPYARQIIHTLTADAAFGAVRINPINVQHLLATSWDTPGNQVPSKHVPEAQKGSRPRE